MRALVCGLAVIFLLSACGIPSPDLDNPTPHQVDESAPTEVVDEASISEFMLPPPLIGGTFRQLRPTSINEVLFDDTDAGYFSVFGALEMDGLIYLYFSNGDAIYYAVSSNGTDWALSPEPIFTGLFNDDFEHFPAFIHAIHEGYAIFCASETVDYAEHDYLYSVWILTAPEPAGPWTLREFPSLIGWHTGREERVPFHITHPIVRPYVDGFRMYYAYSFTLEGIESPEFATAHSWDGLIWRYTPDLPTPEMTEDTFSLGFAEEYDWSGLLVLDVWPTEGGWQMLYLLDENEEDPPQIYLAESEDGLQWAPSDIDIQLPGDQSVEELVSASVLYYQGQYLLYYCAMPQTHQYQCYIAANNTGT